MTCPAESAVAGLGKRFIVVEYIGFLWLIKGNVGLLALGRVVDSSGLVGIGFGDCFVLFYSPLKAAFAGKRLAATAGVLVCRCRSQQGTCCTPCCLRDLYGNHIVFFLWCRIPRQNCALTRLVLHRLALLLCLTLVSNARPALQKVHGFLLIRPAQAVRCGLCSVAVPQTSDARPFFSPPPLAFAVPFTPSQGVCGTGANTMSQTMFSPFSSFQRSGVDTAVSGLQQQEHGYAQAQPSLHGVVMQISGICCSLASARAQANLLQPCFCG